MFGLSKFGASKTTAGTASDCCPTGGKPVDPTKTCKTTDFTDFSKGLCDTAMDTYCRQFEQDGYLLDGKFNAYTSDGKTIYKKPNFATAPLCKKWIEERKPSVTSTIENVCRANVPIYLDTARTKLGLPKDLPECGCITALDEARAAGKKWPVECVDARCTLGGVKTAAMEKTACNIVSCDINMDDVKFLGKNMDVNIQQNCGMNPDGSPASKTSGDSVPASANKTGGSSSLWIGGVVVVLLLVILVAMFVAKSKSKKPMMGGGMYVTQMPMQMQGVPMQMQGVPMQMQGVPMQMQGVPTTTY